MSDWRINFGFSSSQLTMRNSSEDFFGQAHRIEPWEQKLEDLTDTRFSSGVLTISLCVLVEIVQTLKSPTLAPIMNSKVWEVVGSCCFRACAHQANNNTNNIFINWPFKYFQGNNFRVNKILLRFIIAAKMAAKSTKLYPCGILEENYQKEKEKPNIDWYL